MSERIPVSDDVVQKLKDGSHDFLGPVPAVIISNILSISRAARNNMDPEIIAQWKYDLRAMVGLDTDVREKEPERIGGEVISLDRFRKTGEIAPP